MGTTEGPKGITKCQSATVVDGCLAGYLLINNHCVPCVSNGKTCTNTKFTLTALTCADGYYLSSNYVCSSC